MGGSSSRASNVAGKEKVEGLFRQNNRSNRSRSLDTRSEKSVRPVGSSQSARYRQRGAPTLVKEGSSGHISGLSTEQKRMIEVCWFKCSQRQMKRMAEDIFFSILQTDEGLLDMFNLRTVSKSKLRDNEYFKNQAANYALVLNLVVTNIEENFDQAVEALRTLGAQHVRYKSRGFQLMYWDVFTDCFERACPPTFKSRSEREAWSGMILFILQQMKIGYTNEEKLEAQARFLTPPLRV